MAYMYAIPAIGRAAVSVVLAGWFVAEAVGWATNVLPSLARASGIGPQLPFAPTRESPDRAAARIAAQAAGTGATPPGQDAGHAVMEHDPLDGVSVRTTLALMNIAMAFMILVMQFAMPAMSGMAGM
jgi:hypothetical protein